MPSSKMLDKVYTLKEAAKLWGLSSPDLIRQKIARGRFTSAEVRKSADTWLITYDAMIRLYGEIKEDK